MSDSPSVATVPLDTDALIARIKAEAAAYEPSVSSASHGSGASGQQPAAVGSRSAASLAGAEATAGADALRLPRLAFAPESNGAARLGELLSPVDDAAFIEGAYRALLGRNADAAGARGYLDYLQRGGSRLLILYALRYSAEGRAQARPLHPAPWHRLYRLMPIKRALGPWLRRAERRYLSQHPEYAARQAMLELARNLDEGHGVLEAWLSQSTQGLHATQRSTAEAVAQQQQALVDLQAHGEHWGGAIAELRRDGERWGSAIEELRRDGERWGGAIEELRRDGERAGGAIEGLQHDADRQRGQLDQLSQEQARLGSQQDHLRADTRNLADRALAVESSTAQLRGGAEWLQRQLDELKATIERLDSATAGAQQAITTEVARRERLSKDLDFIRSDMIYHRGQARDLIEALRASASTTAGATAPATSQQPAPRMAAVLSADDRLDAYYVAFEEEFRGAPEQIRETQEGYIADLRDAGVVTATKPVLDLGCGRGEWLALLAEHGLSAQGVDTNAVMVARCREQGLDAREADALAALQALPDASLGAISAFHLIEHLPFSLLHALLEQAHRALCPGGVLVLETPNPENVLVGSHTFYHDPTHRNPMTPTATRFLVRYLGFTDPEIRRLHPYPDSARVAGNDPLTERVNGHLCGPQDFAIIAHKPKPATPSRS